LGKTLTKRHGVPHPRVRYPGQNREAALGSQRCLRRRIPHPRPARALPSSANEAGSGTVVVTFPDTAVSSTFPAPAMEVFWIATAVTPARGIAQMEFGQFVALGVTDSRNVAVAIVAPVNTLNISPGCAEPTRMSTSLIATEDWTPTEAPPVAYVPISQSGPSSVHVVALLL